MASSAGPSFCNFFGNQNLEGILKAAASSKHPLCGFRKTTQQTKASEKRQGAESLSTAKSSSVVAIMRRPTYNALVAGLTAATSLAAVLADGTLALHANAGNVASREGQGCHHSFPSFLWAGSKAGEQRQVM